MKVLVFGCNGQVGSQLKRLLAPVDGIDLVAMDIDEVDLTDLDAVSDCLHAQRPDWVINASAHTAVDRAESESELSFQLNARAPETMARACAELGGRFVHYSTDYVFDGQGKRPYRESDTPAPMSVYGRSKLAGETAVLTCLPESIILRTAWVYSRDGHNFVNTMLRLAAERDSLRVVNDQYGSPTLADDLARVTVNIITGIQSGQFSHQGGVFHATGQGETNWYEFCREILYLVDKNDVEVVAIPTCEYPTPAPRPAYSVLDNSKLKSTYNQVLPHWRDSLQRCLGG